MKQLRPFGILAFLAVPAVGCGGDSSPTTQMTVARTVVKFSIPQQVVAVTSADPRYAIEATIPLVAQETGGVKALIDQLYVEATDESTGASSRPLIVRLNPAEAIPAGSTIEMPLRVYLPSTGSFRAKVFLRAYDTGGPSGTVQTGAVPVEGSSINVSTWVSTTFESDAFRILPPQ